MSCTFYRTPEEEHHRPGTCRLRRSWYRVLETFVELLWPEVEQDRVVLKNTGQDFALHWDIKQANKKKKNLPRRRPLIRIRMVHDDEYGKCYDEERRQLSRQQEPIQPIYQWDQHGYQCGGE